MAQFYSLKITALTKDTDSGMRVGFKITDDLKSVFKFKQGQYVTLRKNFEDKEVRRSYSICSDELNANNELEILVKKIPNGIMSTYLNDEVKVDTLMEVMAPTGNFFTNLQAEHKKNYILFASGSGISPVISNAKAILKKEPKSKVYLYYGNRDEKNVLQKKELEQLEKTYCNTFHVEYFYSRSHSVDKEHHGRLNAETITKILNKHNPYFIQAVYFVCGPEEMIYDVVAYLKEKKVPEAQVFFELFATNNTKVDSGKFLDTIPDVSATVTVVFDDDEYSFHLHSKGENILDKCMREGLPAPYSCKGGMCCTCKAQVLEGKVVMEKNYALKEDELKRNMILTCQAHPVTNSVKISFDVI